MCHTLPPLVAKVEAGYYSTVYQVWIDEEHPESSTCDRPYLAIKVFRDHSGEEFKQERETYRMLVGGRNEPSTTNERGWSAPNTGPCSEPEVISIMGLTGNGKSSFIGILSSNENAEARDEQQSQTAPIEMVNLSWNDRNILLADTPGYNDAYAIGSDHRERSGEFFIPVRLFSLPLHESAGVSRSQPSMLRRMVIVATRNSAPTIGIPIRTYGGNGLSKDFANRHLVPPNVHSNPGIRKRSSPMTESEFEVCRKRLRNAFRNCEGTAFTQLCHVLSSLLSSFRPLHKGEIVTILRLFMTSDSQGGENNAANAGSSLETLLGQCNEILYTDAQGTVRFSHPALRDFLTACDIKGVDRTHQTMTKACLVQLELEAGGQQADKNSRAFLKYAWQYWTDHFRPIERSSPGSTARVHRLIWDGHLSKHLGSEEWSIYSGDRARYALEVCRRFKFRVLERMYANLLEIAEAPMIPWSIPLSTEVAVEGSKSMECQGYGSEDNEWVLL